MLQDHLSPVPLACLRCNGEIPPERVGFSEELAESLAFWRDFYRAFYILWLDSGEYESWARAELERPGSPVNVRGLGLVAQLNRHCRTYYWWFQDCTQDAFLPSSACPRCGRELDDCLGQPVCNPCSIVIPNGRNPLESAAHRRRVETLGGRAFGRDDAQDEARK
jgi:hypothetical protein